MRSVIETSRPRGRPAKDIHPAPPDEVMARALRAFATYGYHGVSVRTLNRELGVSHNLLHQRFGSKAAIWRAAVDWGFGGLIAALARTDDDSSSPAHRLRGFIRTFLTFSASQPDLQRLINVESSEASDRLGYIVETYLEPMVARFQPLYDDLVAAGHLRPVPLETLFFLITSGGTAVFSSEGLAGRLFPDGDTPSRVERHAEAVADLIIGGLRPATTDRRTTSTDWSPRTQLSETE